MFSSKEVLDLEKDTILKNKNIQDLNFWGTVPKLRYGLGGFRFGNEYDDFESLFFFPITLS